MQFYNIVSEVLMYSLRKESTKILKGIARMSMDNNHEHSITKDDVRMMKTVLSQFKIVHDELFNQILEKFYVDANQIGVKQNVDNILDNILKYFEIIENSAFYDDALKSNCAKIIDEIQLLVNLTTDQGNKTNWFQFNINKILSPIKDVTNLNHTFNERYFFAPLSNIFQVYDDFDEFSL